MNMKSKVIGAAVGALSLCGLSTAAFAFPQTPPSERVGLDLATPLPEGVYFVDIASIGGYQLSGGGTAAGMTASAFNYNVPVIAWSTPWSFNGVHLTFLAALPEAEVGNFTSRNSFPATSSYSYGLYTPLLAATLGYNFGNGLAISYTAGVYLPMTGTAGFDPLFDTTTFHQMLAIAYHVNNWNFTANLLYNIAGNTGNAVVAGTGATTNTLCAAAGLSLGGGCQGLLGDDFIYSLALTKTIGKWEVGAVAYGFADTTSTVVNRLWGSYTLAGITHYGSQQSSLALGGLVGYNFGPVITQLIVGSDVATTNLPQRDTRGTLHVIIPLWNPETPKVVTAKY
jgi:hypothetical protein